jgi:hypothetical protein
LFFYKIIIKIELQRLIMSITFTGTTIYNRADRCAICMEPLGNGQEVAIHDDNIGRLHPMHSDCINRWIETRPTCPFCNADVEVEAAPVTFMDRVIRAIPNRECLINIGIIAAAAIGAAVVSVTGSVSAGTVAGVAAGTATAAVIISAGPEILVAAGTAIAAGSARLAAAVGVAAHQD